MLLLESKFYGFDSRLAYCGYRTMASTSDCGSDDEGSIPSSHPGKVAQLVEH